MRLINLFSLEFEEFFDGQIPPYAILSHRWNEREVTYKDFLKAKVIDGSSYDKILGFCAFARERKARVWDKQACRMQETAIEWGWVDTYCIDKKSSAELSEAINSMFGWYHNAAVCYVYLADVEGTAGSAAFNDSVWWRRGWTLQELLAPWDVVFCNDMWEVIGHKCTHGNGGRPLPTPCEISYGPSLNSSITALTRINDIYLSGPLYIFDASIACRMSWAASRNTTRVEDLAYCLLGIFEVNMPLLYGGGGKAFLRLQETILRNSNDQSIFAWYSRLAGRGLFASHPVAFAQSSHIILPQIDPLASHSLTSNGLEMRVKAQDAYNHYTKSPNANVRLVKLNCGVYEATEYPGERKFKPAEIALSKVRSENPTQYRRVYCGLIPEDVEEMFPEDIRQDVGDVLLHIKAWDPVHDFA
ncbi:hypothetical protein LTR36_009504 [Oleoguttula mirabilis]|uniref:Heterokaryon incompatibility domain-containing protein n=1 Tax=Oleoguttula mirabilis TaxID=1507867 RepID=A0AAV9JSV1_9PEZI|nr:hypothetical protein LTR36_009504 [Oleoguttula mirabilis]